MFNRYGTARGGGLIGMVLLKRSGLTGVVPRGEDVKQVRYCEGKMISRCGTAKVRYLTGAVPQGKDV